MSVAVTKHKRRLLNLPEKRQAELRLQFPWLKDVHRRERPAEVQVLSVSIFDHWLTPEEDCDLLHDVSPTEQSRRDTLHANFCNLLVTNTSVLSFVFRGQKRDKLVFRRFASSVALSKYCTPHGAKTLRHREFCVALPELDCVFYEGWDDTSHFFFTKPTAVDVISEWALQSGLYLLWPWSFPSVIDAAEKALLEGQLDLLKELLPPLLEQNNPAAIRLSASFFDADTPPEECDRLFVEGMFKAAELGDLKSKYQVGIFYDLGDYGIPQDKVKASMIFKELAEYGDPHCMWIYACELLWGRGAFEVDESKGLQLLTAAASAGSANACMTIAGFHDRGEWGFERSTELRDKYRQLAKDYDETTYDEFA